MFCTQWSHLPALKKELAMADINNADDRYIFEPEDRYIERDRGLRFLCLVGFWVVIPILTAGVGYAIGGMVFNHSVMANIFAILGVGAGAYGMLAALERRFVIRNEITGLFVTQNELASIFGGDVNVFYGPGTHISYPWERRTQTGNITLEEVPVKFDFTVQCLDGTVKPYGSYRLRPDMKHPIRFLSGVAGVASELQGLIGPFILDHFNNLTVREGLNARNEINQALRNRFVNNDDDLEKRFGIIISDVTVDEILPTAEVQKTLSGIAEADAIFHATAKILGYDADTARRLREEGKIPDHVWQRASNQAMAVTGNNEGRQETGYTLDVNLSGIDSDTTMKIVEAGTEMLKSPPGQALVGQMVKRPLTKKIRRKKP